MAGAVGVLGAQQPSSLPAALVGERSFDEGRAKVGCADFPDLQLVQVYDRFGHLRTFVAHRLTMTSKCETGV